MIVLRFSEGHLDPFERGVRERFEALQGHLGSFEQGVITRFGEQDKKLDDLGRLLLQVLDASASCLRAMENTEKGPGGILAAGVFVILKGTGWLVECSPLSRPPYTYSIGYAGCSCSSIIVFVSVTRVVSGGRTTVIPSTRSTGAMFFNSSTY